MFKSLQSFPAAFWSKHCSNHHRRLPLKRPSSISFKTKNPPKPVQTSTDRRCYEALKVYVEPRQNRQLAMEEFKRGVLHVSSTLLTIESTSRCNLRCVMCPHAINAVDCPKTLNGDLAKKLDIFVQRADTIQLHGIGEPLASPAFWKLPTLYRSSINTNSIVLNDTRPKLLMLSNLKTLNISLDVATSPVPGPTTHEPTRGHGIARIVKVRI